MADETNQNRLLDSFRASAEPIFAVDGNQKIHLWTDGMKRLTHYGPEEVSGKFCFNVLNGVDTFGNRYCCRHCPIIQTIERNETIHPFELFISRKGESSQIRVRCTHTLMINQENSSPICIYMLEELSGVEAKPIVNAEHSLSKRELEVLRCLALGMDQESISEKLAIRETTVRNHIQNILRKIGVHSRAEAVAQAYQRKLV